MGALQGLVELLAEQALAVAKGGLLALEELLGAGLAGVEAGEQGVEVLAAGERLLGFCCTRIVPVAASTASSTAHSGQRTVSLRVTDTKEEST